MALWLFYTQQVRVLGVELPSPSSAGSSVRGSPEAPELPVSTPASTAKLAGLAATGGGGVPGGGSSRGAVRSLGPSFGLPGRHQRSEANWQLERQQSEPEQAQDKQPGKFAKSAKQLLSAGLVTLTERLSEALSPPKGARQDRESSAGGWPESPSAAAAVAAADGPYQWPLHAGRRNTVMGFEQQQQQSASASLRKRTNSLASPLRLGTRAMSVAGGEFSLGGASAAAHAAGGSSGGGLQPVAEQLGASWRAGSAGGMRKSGASGGAAHRASAAGDGALSVPLALQASFVHASQSQRLRRRWLLVKAFNR